MIDRFDQKKEAQKDLEQIKYFFRCFFNITESYEDLASIVQDYKKIETKESVNKLAQEIRYIISSEQWNLAKQLVSEFGERTPSNEKVQWLYKSILSGLADNIK